MVEGSSVPSSSSGEALTIWAMRRPTAIPKVTAESPRSENPLRKTSTSTTSTPMPKPTAIGRARFCSPARIVSDTNHPADAHKATKTRRIGSRVLSMGRPRLTALNQENEKGRGDHQRDEQIKPELRAAGF